MQTTLKEFFGFALMGAIGVSILGTFVGTAYWMLRDDFVGFALSIYVPFYGAISVATDLIS